MTATVYLFTDDRPYRKLAPIETAFNIETAWTLMDIAQATMTVANDDPILSLMSDAFDIGNTIAILSDREGMRPWVGWIEESVEDSGAGITTLTLTDFVGTFVEGRRATIVDAPLRAYGAIMRSMLEYAARRGSVPIAIDQSLDAGPILDQDLPLDDLLETLKRLYEFTGYEWWFEEQIDDSGELTVRPLFGSRRGSDLSQAVTLYRDVHFRSAKLRTNALALAETAVIVGGTLESRAIVARQTFQRTGEQRQESVNAQPASSEWIARRTEQFRKAANRREVVHYEPGVSALRDLQGRALTALERPLNGIETLEMTCELSDFSRIPFWIGDTIRVVDQTLRQGRGFDRSVRCMGIQVNEAAGAFDTVWSVEDA